MILRQEKAESLFGLIGSVRSPVSQRMSVSDASKAPPMSELALTGIDLGFANNHGFVRKLCLLSFGAHLVYEDDGPEACFALVDSSIEWLYRYQYATPEKGLRRWTATIHGTVANASSLGIKECEKVVNALRALASLGVPLTTREIIIALAVPEDNFLANKLHFVSWLELYENFMRNKNLEVVCEGVLGHRKDWRFSMSTLSMSEQRRRDQAHSKLLAGILLKRMVESPDDAAQYFEGVCSKYIASYYYNAVRFADLVSLQQAVSKRCDSIASICAADSSLYLLGVVYGQLRDELSLGSSGELHALLALPGMSPSKARALHGNGITTPTKAARCSEQRLAKVLKRSAPSRMSDIEDEVAKRWARDIKRAAQEYVKTVSQEAKKRSIDTAIGKGTNSECASNAALQNEVREQMKESVGRSDKIQGRRSSQQRTVALDELDVNRLSQATTDG